MAKTKKPKDSTSKDKDPAPRFGIGEWYGYSFIGLSAQERKEFAAFKPDKKKRLNKKERDRLAVLEAKHSGSQQLKPKEMTRLTELREKKKNALAANKPCPFKGLATDAICTKDGGVCSLRLYEQRQGVVAPVHGDRGGLRAHCPSRFHEGLEVSKWVGETILGDPSSALAGEVGFLESSKTVDSQDVEDVGRIDMVLVKRNVTEGHPMQWCAMEIQAVYFSGREMGKEFKAIIADTGNSLIFPTEARRPDYRSSGPKRLMPQLQIKVPTLRRWGKKMAVVVDRAFFDSICMGMDNVTDISNADIAWFIVRFEEIEGERRARLVRDEVRYTTLERSVEGLTGGKPVPLPEFEARITKKITSPVTEQESDADLFTFDDKDSEG